MGLPAPDGDVDIVRVDLNRPRLAPGLLRCDQDRAAAAERVEHQSTTTRTVPQRVGNERKRLDGRMHRQFFEAPLADRGDACIVPDIGPMTSVLA